MKFGSSMLSFEGEYISRDECNCTLARCIGQDGQLKMPVAPPFCLKPYIEENWYDGALLKKGARLESISYFDWKIREKVRLEMKKCIIEWLEIFTILSLMQCIHIF